MTEVQASTVATTTTWNDFAKSIKTEEMTDSETKGSKKSRKSRAPVPFYRASPSPSVKNTSSPPPVSNASSSNDEHSYRNGPPGIPGGVKSYSDFMRNLAAKYNNNEYVNSGISSMPDLSMRFVNPNLMKPPSDTPINPAAAAAALLGFPPHFPFHNLSFPNQMSNHEEVSKPPVSESFGTLSRSNEAKRHRQETPLDLTPPAKRANSSSPDPTVLGWSVNEVVNFVSSIDICKEYAEVFKEHNIDGTSLPLLTEDHLTNRLGLKLGPALKLRSLIAKKLGGSEICAHCSHCHMATSVSPDIESFKQEIEES